MDGCSPDDLQKCSHCSYKGLRSTFPEKTLGVGYTKTCKTCKAKSDANNARTRLKNQANKENNAVPTSQAPPAVTINPSQGLGTRETVSWATLASRLALGRTEPCKTDVILTLEPSDPAADARSEFSGAPVSFLLCFSHSGVWGRIKFL